MTGTQAPGVWLSRGTHAPDEGAYCLLEHIAARAGEQWTDHPRCVHPVLAAAARVVNDRLPPVERQQLLAYEDRLMGTGADRADARLAVQLAIWSAQQVLGLCRDQDREVCEQAVTAARAWVRAPSAAAAAAAVNAAFGPYAAAAGGAPYADALLAAGDAATAAGAPTVRGAATLAAGAATHAARAAVTGGAGAALAFLAGLAGEYERLTRGSEVTP